MYGILCMQPVSSSIRRFWFVNIMYPNVILVMGTCLCCHLQPHPSVTLWKVGTKTKNIPRFTLHLMAVLDYSQRAWDTRYRNYPPSVWRLLKVLFDRRANKLLLPLIIPGCISLTHTHPQRQVLIWQWHCLPQFKFAQYLVYNNTRAGQMSRKYNCVRASRSRYGHSSQD